MGHLVNSKEEVYRALAERLNRFPVGVVVNGLFLEILQKMFTESEALLGGKMPLLPMTLEKIADITGMSAKEMETTLEDMAGKGLVVDLPRKGEIYYVLSPLVVGFFEYTFMRTGQPGQKELAELFEKYFADISVRKELFGSSTKMFKAMVYESLIPVAVQTEVLSYERATEVIRQSGGGGIGVCACRHEASHHGRDCSAPKEVCTSLGPTAEWLVRRGFARAATVDDLLRNLELTEKHGLVHLGDNVLNRPAFMCNCCGCCCGVLRTITESNIMSVHPSNFIPRVDAGSCLGCGQCSESCQVRAIKITPGEGGIEIPLIDEGLCLGCGVCAAACPTGALSMDRRAVIHVPPNKKKDQMIAIALEKNKILT